MKAYLVTNVMGSFAFDTKGKLIAKKLFQKKPEDIAKKLDSKELIPEEKHVLKELRKNGFKDIVTDKNVKFLDVSIEVEEDNKGKKALQESFRGLAISLKWVTSQSELNELLGKVQILRTKEQLRGGSRDRIIMHTIGMIEEMDKDLNAFSERLREWYGLYFPELSREIQGHERFLELISSGRREKIKGFEALSKETAGMEFSDEDIKEIQDFSHSLLGLFKQKKTLAAYLESICKESIPNTSAVAGEALAARLLSHAGGLEKLSRLPSSTVQLLGAEKALFRHLKGGGKPPKFGALFAHPLIQNAPREKRGKVARLLAAKISLASKIDFFSKNDKGDEIREELEKQVKNLV